MSTITTRTQVTPVLPKARMQAFAWLQANRNGFSFLYRCLETARQYGKLFRRRVCQGFTGSSQQGFLDGRPVVAKTRKATPCTGEADCKPRLSRSGGERLTGCPRLRSTRKNCFFFFLFFFLCDGARKKNSATERSSAPPAPSRIQGGPHA